MGRGWFFIERPVLMVGVDINIEIVDSVIFAFVVYTGDFLNFMSF